jgi:hypothetical protein
MSLRVFVSSTRGDLDPDCRPRVIRVIQDNQAAAVVMETWPAEYVPALELVREKLDQSSHYFGLFAYRRGWTPPGEAVSITEAEFDHACSRMQRVRIVVFVPRESSEIAAVLRERAEQAQELADEEAQERFLARVRSGGAVQDFGDLDELGRWATRRVVLWDTSLLEVELSKHRDVPGLEEVAKLGRHEHLTCFERVLGRLAPGGNATAAGVLLAGPPRHGQAQLAALLQRHFDRSFPRGQALTVGCGPLWRSGSLPAFLKVLGGELRTAPFASVTAAADHLGDRLARGNLLLRVTNLQNFEGGVGGFVESFWAPLVDALPPDPPFRFLCIATHESTAPGANDAAATAPCAADPPDPRRLTVLPELRPFTRPEVTLFVRRSGLHPDPDALAEYVVQETGGAPMLTYDLLTDPTTWQS